MVGTKEMVEDTVGKTTEATIEENGKAISMAMQLLGAPNGRRIMPTDGRKLEIGDKLSTAAIIVAALALEAALGTRGTGLEGTRGPTANRVREEEEKEKRDTRNLLLRHTRERPGAGARTRTGTTTGSPPKAGGPTMKKKIGVIRGRPTS